jgi:hypothetical protein
MTTKQAFDDCASVALVLTWVCFSRTSDICEYLFVCPLDFVGLTPDDPYTHKENQWRGKQLQRLKRYFERSLTGQTDKRHFLSRLYSRT